MDATISQQGILTAEPDALLSAGAIKVSSGSLSGVARGRVIPNLPYNENFEDGFSFQHTSSDQISFSYPPLPWLGARMRWQVQKMGENTVAGNTLDRVLFQRAINFLGHKDMSNYTMEADVMTDGDRRIKSNVGLINQRYIFVLVEIAKNWKLSRTLIDFGIQFPFQSEQILGIALKHMSLSFPQIQEL